MGIRKFSVVFFIMVIISSILTIHGEDEVTNKTAAEIFPVETFKQMLGDHATPDNVIQTQAGFTMQDIEADTFPASLDWRNSNIVTSVKNQGSCGSCWAFSAIGVIEALVKMVDNRTVDLSEQQMVDCVASSDC